jgi:transposase
MSKQQMALEVVNPNSAGVDVGSRSHWVAVGQNAQDVKEFGVYSQDQQEMCIWLQQHQVTSIAMESTGTYWQNLFSTLVAAGFDVILVNGKQTKNIKGKKTDIKDCQWIQKLHSLGLLSNSFLPDSTTDVIRTYSRHRLNLIEQSANCTKRMQKFLRLMNMRLDVVVNDINGLTGQQIIAAFIGGETEGKKLAQLRNHNCKKSEEEIAKALQYNGRTDYLFALKQEYKTYQHLQQQVIETDSEIKKLLENIIDKDDNKKQHIATAKPHKRKNKNSITNANINQIAYQYFEGIDLMAIEGVNEATIMAIISEVGIEGMKKFETAKQFTSWLRLAPNNKISGGKVLSHHLPKGSSRLKLALRNAANAIGQLKEGYLVEFFRKICYKKGRATAVSALARKLGVIIWNMIVKTQLYKPPTQYLFLDEKRKLGLVKKIKKQISKFELTTEDLGLTTI